MRFGRPRGESPDPEGARQGGFPFGSLLVLGEAVLLLVLVVHGIGAPAALWASESPVASPSHIRSTHASHAPTPTPTTAPPTTTPPAPATTVPATPVVTVPATPVVTVPAKPAAATPVATRGIVPPAVPSANIAPHPDFLQSCSGAAYDDSAACTTATLEAIAYARSTEGLPPMTLPSNWAQLSPEEQIFVATDLERTARGLPPLSAMVDQLDQAARQGALQDTDPSPPSGFPYQVWGSNWAGAVGNPLEAMYLWMYDDGLGSANVDCTATNQSGCWGHRKNVLMQLSCQGCVMGAAWVAGAYKGDPSTAELLVETSGRPAPAFTWQQEEPFLS